MWRDDSLPWRIQKALHILDFAGSHGGSCIYFVQPYEMDVVKIGTTSLSDPLQRLSGLRTACPLPLVCLMLHRGTRETEQELHGLFADIRLHGEWFILTEELRRIIALAGEQSKARTARMRRRRPDLQVRELRHYEIRESLDRKAKDWVSKYGDLIPTHHTP